MLTSIRDGLWAGLRHPKLVLLIWTWNLLLALCAALPAFGWWTRAFSRSPEASTLLQRFNFGVLADLTKYDEAGGFALLFGAVGGLMFLSLLASAFVMGGILEVLANDDDARPFLHRFFRGGGHFFWRFVRLLLIAGVCLVVVVATVSATVGALTAPMADSEWEPAGYLVGLGNLLVLAIVAAFFLLGLDYARIKVAALGSHGMLRAYFGALGFVARHLFATYAMALVMVVLMAALMLAYLGYETYRTTDSWGAIALLLAVQQAVVLGRAGLRVALVGAERSFYARRTPVAMTAPSAVPAGAISPTAGIPADETLAFLSSLLHTMRFG